MSNLTGIMVLLDQKKISLDDPRVIKAFLDADQVLTLLQGEEPARASLVSRLRRLIAEGLISMEEAHNYDAVLPAIITLHRKSSDTRALRDDCWYIVSRSAAHRFAAAEYVCKTISGFCDTETDTDGHMIWKGMLSDVVDVLPSCKAGTLAEMAKMFLSEARNAHLHECLGRKQRRTLSEIEREYMDIQQTARVVLAHSSPSEIDDNIYNTLLAMAENGEFRGQLIAIQSLATRWPYKQDCVENSREMAIRRVILAALSDSDHPFVIAACAEVVQEQYIDNESIYRTVEGTDRVYREDQVLNKIILKHIQERRWSRNARFIPAIDTVMIMSEELVRAIVIDQGAKGRILDSIPVRNILCSYAIEEFLPAIQEVFFIGVYLDIKENVLDVADPPNAVSKRAFKEVLKAITLHFMEHSATHYPRDIEDIFSYLYPKEGSGLHYTLLDAEDHSFILAVWKKNVCANIAGLLIDILLKRPFPQEKLDTLEAMSAGYIHEPRKFLEHVDFPRLFAYLLPRNARQVYRWISLFQETTYRENVSTHARLHDVMRNNLHSIIGIMNARVAEWERETKSDILTGADYLDWRDFVIKPFKELFALLALDPNEALTSMLLTESMPYKRAHIIGELMVK